VGRLRPGEAPAARVKRVGGGGGEQAAALLPRPPPLARPPGWVRAAPRRSSTAAAPAPAPHLRPLALSPGPPCSAQGLGAEDTREYVAQLVTQQMGSEGFVLRPDQVGGAARGLGVGGAGGIETSLLLPCPSAAAAAACLLSPCQPYGRPSPPLQQPAGLALTAGRRPRPPQVLLVSARDALLSRLVLAGGAPPEEERRFMRIAFGSRATGRPPGAAAVRQAAGEMLEVQAPGWGGGVPLAIGGRRRAGGSQDVPPSEGLSQRAGLAAPAPCPPAPTPGPAARPGRLCPPRRTLACCSWSSACWASCLAPARRSSSWPPWTTWRGCWRRWGPASRRPCCRAPRKPAAARRLLRSSPCPLC
jgi:hypothetical protein